MADRFEFSFDDRWRPWLRAIGVTAARAWATIDDVDLIVRFGPWRLSSPVANVAGVEATGPYAWWRAIGPHLSLADQGATFGTSTQQGACVRFHEPMPGLTPLSWPRHPGVTVTLADVAGFVDRLRARG